MSKKVQAGVADEKCPGTQAEIDQYRRLRAKGNSREAIRTMMATKFTRQRWTALMRWIDNNLTKAYKIPALALAKAEQLDKVAMIQELAIKAHTRIMDGTVRKTVISDSGTTEITETQIPNTRALDTMIKATELESHLTGTKAIQEHRIIMQEFSASVNAIIAALTRHLLPDNEGIYLKIMADIEKETAKVPGL
jgi:hypothetical protein